MSTEIIMTLEQGQKIYIDVLDHSLAQKWLAHFKELVQQNYFLEKSYCFLGYLASPRNGDFLCNEINKAIEQVNAFFSDRYQIDRVYSMDTLWHNKPHPKYENNEYLNWLHRYFEDLQGTTGPDGLNLSPFYYKADNQTKLAIRNLNLLCHETESWLKSYGKRLRSSDREWTRPSQLMCYANAPRFVLTNDDLEFFGCDTLYRDLGGVYLGTNKAIGKTHFEVFLDEQESDVNHLVTTVMRPQTLAAGDCDIEWGKTITPATQSEGVRWKFLEVERFKSWLLKNGLDYRDKSLGIGAPKVAQVNLEKSFNTTDFLEIVNIMSPQLNVVKIEVDGCVARYEYNWSDSDFDTKLINALYS